MVMGNNDKIYRAFIYMKEWIQNLNKNVANGSSMWKALVSAFFIVGNFLAWRIGNGTKVKLGVDPWIGRKGVFRLSSELILVMR
jgi:hypothetical protein